MIPTQGKAFATKIEEVLLSHSDNTEEIMPSPRKRVKNEDPDYHPHGNHVADKLPTVMEPLATTATFIDGTNVMELALPITGKLLVACFGLTCTLNAVCLLGGGGKHYPLVSARGGRKYTLGCLNDVLHNTAIKGELPSSQCMQPATHAAITPVVDNNAVLGIVSVSPPITPPLQTVETADVLPYDERAPSPLPKPVPLNIPAYLLDSGDDGNTSSDHGMFLVTVILGCHKPGSFFCQDEAGKQHWLPCAMVPPALLYLFLKGYEHTGVVQPALIDWVASPQLSIPSTTKLQQVNTALLHALQLSGTKVVVKRKTKQGGHAKCEEEVEQVATITPTGHTTKATPKPKKAPKEPPPPPRQSTHGAK